MDKKKELQQAITDFRKKHVGELEKCMEVSKLVRDGELEKEITCPSCKAKFITKPLSSARDINEAVKTISRLLGSLQPERIAPAKSEGRSNGPTITEEEEQEIKRQIAEVLGG